MMSLVYDRKRVGGYCHLANVPTPDAETAVSDNLTHFASIIQNDPTLTPFPVH